MAIHRRYVISKPRKPRLDLNHWMLGFSMDSPPTKVVGLRGAGWFGMLTFTYMPRCWCYVDYLVGRGGMLTFIYILTIHRSSQPWAICFIARNSFFGKREKGPADCRAQCALTRQIPHRDPQNHQAPLSAVPNVFFFKFLYSSFLIDFEFMIWWSSWSISASKTLGYRGW